MSDPALNCHSGTQPATWAWISGWGVQPERFEAAAKRALPQATHRVYAPEPGAVDAFELRATHIGGYFCAHSIASTSRSALLPRADTAFARGQLGGQPRILTSLQAKLELPEAALKLFYRLCGLAAEPNDALPYAAPSLTCPASRRCAPRMVAACACCDWQSRTLMDADSLQGSFHITQPSPWTDYHDLLAALSELQ